VKTQILFISANTTIGGQEVVLKRLLRNVDGDRFHKDVLVTHERGPLHVEYERYSDNLFYAQDMEEERDLYGAIFSVIRKNGYDVVHFFNLWGLYDIIPRLRRVFPKIKIMTTLCVDLYFHRDSYPREIQFIEKVQKHLWASVTDAELNRKSLPGVTVIRNGISPDIFKPALKTPKSVAWVGRLHGAKRAHLIPEIARRLPEYSFTMIGDGETETYKEIIDDLPPNLEIKLELSEEEVAEVLSTSQYFLFTSISEAMPLTILEAMACGCCVISEKVGDTPSVLEDGINGHLIPSVSTEGLILNWVVDNLPELDLSVVDNARQTILEGFTIEQSVKKYEFLYDAIGSHEGQPRLAFIWGYPDFHKGFWETKQDSLQHAISELSKDHVVQVYAPTDKAIVPRKIFGGQNIQFYRFGQYKDVIIQLKRFAPDMILLHSFESPLWSHIVRSFPDTWKSLMHFGNLTLTSSIIQDIDMVFFQQDYLMKPASKKSGVPLDRIKVLPFGIRLDMFNQQPFKSRHDDKQYTGIMVADFRKEIKRQHLLIEAWKDIPGRLLLLGRFERSLPPDYHAECIALTEKLCIDDRVEFINGCPHSEVPDIIRKAKIGFLTSQWEGGSVAQKEMMACGLPMLVLSDCHGTLNMITPGVDGLIADPTPESISLQAWRLLENWEEMGDAAAKTIREGYSYEHMIGVLRETITEAMGGQTQ